MTREEVYVRLNEVFRDVFDELKLERTRRDYVANISHEIRTPMNAIIGYTGMAQTHIDNKDQVQTYLDKISKSSNHLLSLINDVLDMSRIESGKMTLNEKPESLSEIVHTLRDIVQSDIHAKSMELFIDVENIQEETVISGRNGILQSMQEMGLTVIPIPVIYPRFTNINDFKNGICIFCLLPDSLAVRQLPVKQP